ncbi:MAG TPA: calcium-translocating P-type ATPase, PMCA-type [Bacteroidales bacterium]|jgi:P-type Ca2+ transporter type 2C|nr:calcium-translocating P-type ATPase, PMCA-type [Bacteroidales bacterium]HBZ20343.1 calcium-translocating P-type ATPase, PMCA-type [Bacteroidales bacterium]
MIQFYRKEASEIITSLKSDATVGLSTDEVKRRLGEYGYNQLASKRRKSFVILFLEQFKSFMIIILLIAAAISGVVGVKEGEGLLDTYVILGILIVNAFVGAFQERKAETSLEALKSLAAPLTRVLRDGVIKEVLTQNLVPGDIVILETGAIIPADLRLSEAVNLKIQESALTGESVPVEKRTDTLPGKEIPLGDRVNMAFSSGMVTYGRGRGIVVATGMQTEVGKIANLLQETVETETPMSRRLSQLGKVLGIAALAICGLIFLVGILYGNSVISMFMTAVSLAVAAIPEGLPAVSTVVLAIGVQRMVKKNAIIRTLPSVETLGSATFICSDKTGTLTQNKMTIVEAYVNHKHDVINRAAPATLLNDEENRLLAISVLCADAQARTNDDGTIEFTGDPTETALLDFGILYGVNKDEVEKRFPRIAEIPFDSERKRMTTVNRMSGTNIRVNVKGGLDEVLAVCDRIIINGIIRPVEADDKRKILQANEAMAGSALRVLAMAYKDLQEAPRNVHIGDLETGLIFIGMLGMIDPARPEVVEAVTKCNTAGIRAVMITGDHLGTAMAIAREIGILRDGDAAVTGADLEKQSEAEFASNVHKYAVYARVAPEHKVRIVKALQKHNEVVAMTGDGVNDAPALKQADIGAAMGIVGTDVAKGAADMVLTDDNFATIVSAVEEGRRIYDNILKAIQFLLSTNIGEIFLLLVTSIFNLGTPLLPIHILWVNLVTDSLPALALSVDPAEKGIMNRKPRNSKKGFMTNGMVWRIMYQGIMIGAIPLAAFIIGLREQGVVLGQTMAFATLMFAQLAHVRNLHSNTRSSLAISPFKNIPLIAAIAVSAALALIVLLIPPVRDAFSLTELDGRHWLAVALMSLIPILVVDIFKLFRINTTRDERIR